MRLVKPYQVSSQTGPPKAAFGTMPFVRRFLGRRHVVREALPDAIALSRLACRVRTFVGQDSDLVGRRIINDTIGIVSHDRTGASLCRRLAALPFSAATRLHLELALRHLAFVICHLAFVICHLAFVICHSSFAICHLPFGICHPPFPHSAFRIPHSAFSVALPAFAAALGAGPTGTAGAARTPGCNRAPRGRPNRGPRPLRWLRSWPAAP